MWGGVKHLRDVSSIFREWSATKSVDSLRRALYTEPRPWWVGFKLHQFRHSLDDRTAAKLMRWCATVFSLESNADRKRSAYRHSQELYSVLESRHRISDDTFAQYLSLCEAGGDVSSAYQWIRYYVDKHERLAGSVAAPQSSSAPSSLPPVHRLWHYVWLLRVVAQSPNDACVDEMVTAVREVYEEVFCAADDFGEDDESIRGAPSADGGDGLPMDGALPQRVVHMVPKNEEERVLQRELFSLMVSMAHRMQDKALSDWVHEAAAALSDPSLSSQTPVPTTDSAPLLSALRLKHCVFPQLEMKIDRFLGQRPSIKQPYLVDSILSPAFVNTIESASFSQDVGGVTRCINAYLEDIAHEKQMQGNDVKGKQPLLHRKTATNPVPVWRDYHDAVHRSFRRKMVEEQGVPPELYHYLIVALAVTSPRLALSTKQKMVEKGMRVLDLTRAVLLVACRESPEDQRLLLAEQREDASHRTQLDADYECTKVVESFWKCDYGVMFHYRNSLKMADFYATIMNELGVADVQRLIATSSPTPLAEEDVVVVDDDARDAIAKTLRRARGGAAVEGCLDLITEHCPQLDIALVNAMPCFKDYALPAVDDIATSMDTLQQRLAGKTALYVLDASFIETSEQFFTVCSRGGEESLLVVPWFCLAQLAETAEGDGGSVFDAELNKFRTFERTTARQRLQQLASLLSRTNERKSQPRSSSGAADATQDAELPPSGNEWSNGSPDIIVLHFSECLMAQALPASLPLRPEDNDNDLLMAISMMLSQTGETMRVVLCSDDPQLVRRATEDTSIRPLLGKVSVLGTRVDEDAAQGASDASDGTLSEETVQFVAQLADSFDPVVDEPVRGHHPTHHAEEDGQPRPTPVASTAGETVAASTPTEYSASSWLAMLDDLNDGDVSPASLSTPRASSENVVGKYDETGLQQRAALRHDDHGEVEAADGADAPPETSTTTALFEEFHVTSPDEILDKAMKVTPGTGHEEKRRYVSALERESLRNRGYSKKRRLQLANKLSHIAGSRVPHHFKFSVFEANVNDPRNAHLVQSYGQAHTNRAKSDGARRGGR